MKSETIVAANADPFNASHYGAVADLFDVAERAGGAVLMRLDPAGASAAGLPYVGEYGSEVVIER
jgi:hypothetical protein